MPYEQLMRTVGSKEIAHPYTEIVGLLGPITLLTPKDPPAVR